MQPTLRHDILPVSTAEPVRFTPDNLAGEDPPVFLLRVPTLREHFALEAAIAVEGVRYPSPDELIEAVRGGIKEHVVDDEQPPLLELVKQWEGHLEEKEDVPPDLVEQIEQIQRVLRPHHRELARIEAERSQYLSIALLVRAEKFTVGLEGPDAPAIVRRAGRLTDDCVQALVQRYGRETLFSIGARTITLSQPQPEQVGNSESPPPSPPGPATSRAARTRQTARNGKFSDDSTNAIHD